MATDWVCHISSCRRSRRIRHLAAGRAIQLLEQCTESTVCMHAAECAASGQVETDAEVLQRLQRMASNGAASTSAAANGASQPSAAAGSTANGAAGRTASNGAAPAVQVCFQRRTAFAWEGQHLLLPCTCSRAQSRTTMPASGRLQCLVLLVSRSGHYSLGDAAQANHLHCEKVSRSLTRRASSCWCLLPGHAQLDEHSCTAPFILSTRHASSCWCLPPGRAHSAAAGQRVGPGYTAHASPSTTRRPLSRHSGPPVPDRHLPTGEPLHCCW